MGTFAQTRFYSFVELLNLEIILIYFEFVSLLFFFVCVNDANFVLVEFLF